jgi:secondary thiamine-phosphate synthase enzyme
MSRRSTVTVRERPVTATASVSGAAAAYSETFTVESSERIQVLDLTDRVMAIVASLGIKEGIVNVSSLHTTCAVFINEFQAALVADIKTFIEKVVSHDAGWLHNDPAHSDCDRRNADAHLRAMLFEHSVTLQVAAGEVVLGQWQRVLMAELDGPRARTFRLLVMGVK